MKPSADEVQMIAVGDIFQISGEEDHGYRLRFLVADKVETWGIVGYVAGVDGGISRVWSLIEPTGGKVAFGRDGKPFAPPATTLKYHP